MAMAQAGGQLVRREAPCPAVLRLLYGESNVLTLRELLVRLSALSAAAAHLPAVLVQPHDHRDYVQGLLANTLCVLNPGVPALRDGFSLQQLSNQTEASCRAGGDLARGAGCAAASRCQHALT